MSITIAPGVLPQEVRSRKIPPEASASAFAPCGRRRMWWASFVCPHCRGGHFTRSWKPFVDGKRRVSCGRVVNLRIRRTYTSATAVKV